jgi:hypothetical protein
VSLSEVSEVLAALLDAPVLPGGGAVIEVAGTGVDAGDVTGQLAAALSSIAEKNAGKVAELDARQAQAAAARQQQRAALPVKRPESPSLFGLGAKVCGCVFEAGGGGGLR